MRHMHAVARYTGLGSTKGAMCVASQVLAAAASNIAVDNLVERLRRAQPKLDVVRVGHPARLLPEVGWPGGSPSHLVRMPQGSGGQHRMCSQRVVRTGLGCIRVCGVA